MSSIALYCGESGGHDGRGMATRTSADSLHMVVSYWSLGLVEVYDLDPQATSASATYVRTIGSQGSGNAQLYTPERLVFTPSNSFLVADAGNNRVQELPSA